MKPLEHLKLLIIADYMRRNPNIPAHAIPVNVFGTAKREKREKKRIEKMLQLLPKCTGSIIENRGQVKIDNIGSGNQYKPKISFIGSGMRRGIEDVTAVINGRMVAIELKLRYKNGGRDRQSKWQKQRQVEVEEAGGLYMIVDSFADFYQKLGEIYDLQATTCKCDNRIGDMYHLNICKNCFKVIKL